MAYWESLKIAETLKQMAAASKQAWASAGKSNSGLGKGKYKNARHRRRQKGRALRDESEERVKIWSPDPLPWQLYSCEYYMGYKNNSK